MEQRSQRAEKRAVSLTEPESTLARRNKDHDPRLVALVRLLARRAAREWYEERMKERGASRS
jgi:hypothetical protein